MAIPGERPAGDAPDQGAGVRQLGQQHAQHVRQVWQQALGAAIADRPKGKDGAFPGSPIFFLVAFQRSIFLSRELPHIHANLILDPCQ